MSAGYDYQYAPVYKPTTEPSNGHAPVLDDEKAASVPPEQAVQLKRRVSLLSGVALIVGTMIGSGIFVSPKGVLERSGSVGLSLVVWAGCGVLSLFGALSLAELGTMIHKSGGEFIYILTAFSGEKRGGIGAVPAFLQAWTTVLLLKPASLGIMTLSFAKYVILPALPGCQDTPPVPTKMIASLCICMVALVNCYSVKLATRIQNVFTVTKLVAIGIIIIAGIVKVFQGHTQYLATGFQGSTTSVSDIATAFYSGLWAYDGWNNLNYITEELVNPYVNLPRAIIIGIPLVTLCYVFVNLSYMSVMSSTELLASEAVAVRFGDHVLGPAAVLICLFVAASTFGSGNGTTFTAARISFVAAREGHLAEVLSYAHVRKLTPMPALMLNSMLAICMVSLADIGSLIDFFSFAAWMFYGATMLALIVMRWTKKELYRPYRVPIVIPWIVLLLSIYLVAAPIIQKPQVEYVYACLFIASGIFFYVPFVHYKVQLLLMKKVTMFLQLILNVVPTAYTDSVQD
ncbi:b(0,+)-type amino acid transporter 1-like [Ornithodoros turicata]|uniref:b(0,+)-type amino acid transporter 1-like n=1 Tax=Ornithodoros turicata TaxID=34597 RepID=UPI003139F330